MDLIQSAKEMWVLPFYRIESRFKDLRKFHLIFSCRDKKDTEVQSLEVAKDMETGTISELEQRNEAMRDKLSSLKVKLP